MAIGRIDGQTAIITGGGSGIGMATAQLFAQEGASVVIADLQTSNGATVAKEIGAEFVVTDVRNPKSVEALVNGIVERHGHLDIMFNNAGIGAISPLVEMQEEVYLNLIRTDLDGVYWGLKFAGRVMLKQKHGAIVNTSSVAGVRGTAGLSAYTAAKAGIIGLTQTAAVEFAAAGVRVNCVVPGTINTGNRGHAIDPVFREKLASYCPMARLGEASEVARSVLFLASDDASFVTGQVLAVDGGMCAFGGLPGDLLREAAGRKS